MNMDGINLDIPKRHINDAMIPIMHPNIPTDVMIIASGKSACLAGVQLIRYPSFAMTWSYCQALRTY